MKRNDEIYVSDFRLKTLDKRQKNMKNQPTAIENTLMKLTFKQKNFIYTIARLEYRIWKALTKLEIVNTLIEEEQDNINSLNAAIKAAGNGKVADKLMIWKTKAEYRLFKLNLRKNKIDVIKIIINESKLEQTKRALIALEKDIANIEVQKPRFAEVVKIDKPALPSYPVVFKSWERLSDEENPVHQSIKAYLKEYFEMAS